MTDTDDHWAELFDAIPSGWVVGRPPYDESAKKWRLFSYDRRRAVRGGAPLALEAEGGSEEQAVREMTRKLKRARPTR
jgi:hypothetical protein